jgi:Tfp pilus assembly major pilin PilA
MYRLRTAAMVAVLQLRKAVAKKKLSLVAKKRKQNPAAKRKQNAVMTMLTAVIARTKTTSAESLAIRTHALTTIAKVATRVKVRHLAALMLPVQITTAMAVILWINGSVKEITQKRLPTLVGRRFYLREITSP